MSEPQRDLQIVSAYRRALVARGEAVTVRRVTGQAPDTVETDAVVEAMVMNFQVEPSVMDVTPEGAVTLGDRLVIVLEDDLRAQQFPLPVRKNDKVLVRGEWLNVENIDPNKRGIAGAIEIHARGSR